MSMATSGQKELRRKWPVTEGLTAGTTTQEGREMSLQPQVSSKVPRRLKAGFS